MMSVPEHGMTRTHSIKRAKLQRQFNLFFLEPCIYITKETTIRTSSLLPIAAIMFSFQILADFGFVRLMEIGYATSTKNNYVRAAGMYATPEIFILSERSVIILLHRGLKSDVSSLR